LSVHYILAKMGDNFQTWKTHFIQQAKGLIPHERRFYRVSMQEGKGDEPPIKMVSPTEQVVDRARSSLNEPPSVYDPVSGVMQHTEGKHTKLIRKRKKKSMRPTNRVKYSKKRKTSKITKNPRNKKKLPKTSKKTSTKKTLKKKIKTKKKWWM